MAVKLIIDIHNEIRSANKNFMKAFERNDAVSIANLYTEDAQLLPTHSDFISSKENIKEFWQQVLNTGITKVHLDTIEVENHSDTAIETGKYILSNDEKDTIDSGKYIVIWKKQDGQWYLHKDIWNSSLAPFKQLGLRIGAIR